MLYLTCTTITSVDLAQYGVALAEDWVSVECGTSHHSILLLLFCSIYPFLFLSFSHIDILCHIFSATIQASIIKLGTRMSNELL